MRKPKARSTPQQPAGSSDVKDLKKPRLSLRTQALIRGGATDASAANPRKFDKNVS